MKSLSIHIKKSITEQVLILSFFSIIIPVASNLLLYKLQKGFDLFDEIISTFLY